MATIVHFDISAENIERAKAFYEQIFNWEIEKLPGQMDYHLIKTNDLQGKCGIGGGMSKREPGVRSGIINYIGVASIDASLKQVVDLGGKILQTVTKVPGFGLLAICADPEGNVFGLFEEVSEPILGHKIKEISWPDRTFIVRKAKLSFDKLPAFFKESYGEIYKSLLAAGIHPTEFPCAFYYSIDEIKKETDFAAAVPVPGDTPDIPGFEKLVMPSSKLTTTTHIGPYETMAPAYATLEGYIDAKHLKKGLVIEEYCSDPEIENDPNKWVTNIYFQLI